VLGVEAELKRRDIEISDEVIDSLIRKIKSNYYDLVVSGAVKFYPDAVHFLESLKMLAGEQGVHLVFASNTEPDVITELFRRNDSTPILTSH